MCEETEARCCGGLIRKVVVVVFDGDEVERELVAQMRALLAAVPRPGAPVAQVAWFLLRKAEVLDLAAIFKPAIALSAKDVATRARYQARALTGEDRAV